MQIFANFASDSQGQSSAYRADIGISLPGTGEEPAAPVFVDGRKTVTLRGNRIADDFKAIVEDYVRSHYPLRTDAEADDQPVAAVR